PTSYQAAPPRIEPRRLAAAAASVKPPRTPPRTPLGPARGLRPAGRVAMLPGLRPGKPTVSTVAFHSRGGLPSMCKRFRRLPAVLLLALLAALVVRVPTAGAAAEFHKFNVVLSAIPTQLRATDFNRVIDATNAQ